MKKILLILGTVLVFTTSAWAVSGFPTKGEVLNQTLTIAGQEYVVTLPDGIGGITMQSRTAADFKVAFNTTESTTKYFTVKSGTVLNSPTLGLASEAGGTLKTTIFLNSTSAGQVVEILYWN